MQLNLIKKIKNNYDNRFLRNIVALTGASVLGKLLLLLGTPILARIYSPEDFGVLALFTSLVAILSVNSSLRYELAILLPKHNLEAFNLLVLSITISFITSFFIFLTFPLITKFDISSDFETIVTYYYLIPLSILGLGLYRSLNFWAVRKKEYGKIAKTKISQNFWMVISQIALGLFLKGPIGLLIGDSVGRVSGSGSLGRLVWKEERKVFREVSFRVLFSTAKKYVRFPLITSWSGLFNTTVLQGPPLMLLFFYGSTVGGLFALGMRIIGTPLGMISVAVSQVYLSEVPKLHRENSKELLSLFIKTARNLCLIIIVPCLTLYVLGPTIFEFIFGAIWRDSGVYMKLLSIMFFFEFIVSPLSKTLDLINKQHLLLYWEVVRFSLIFFTLSLPLYNYIEPTTLIFFYGIASSIAYGVLFILIYLVLWKKGK